MVIQEAGLTAAGCGLQHAGAKVPLQLCQLHALVCHSSMLSARIVALRSAPDPASFTIVEKLE